VSPLKLTHDPGDHFEVEFIGPVKNLKSDLKYLLALKMAKKTISPTKDY
jgi:hypothetical protein